MVCEHGIRGAAWGRHSKDMASAGELGVGQKKRECAPRGSLENYLFPWDLWEENDITHVLSSAEEAH
jgi:hypothetical protein